MCAAMAVVRLGGESGELHLVHGDGFNDAVGGFAGSGGVRGVGALLD